MLPSHQCRKCLHTQSPQYQSPGSDAASGETPRHRWRIAVGTSCSSFSFLCHILGHCIRHTQTRSSTLQGKHILKIFAYQRRYLYDLLIERQLEQGSVSVAGPVHMADETVLPSQSMHCLVLDLLQSLTSPSHSPHALQSPNADK